MLLEKCCCLAVRLIRSFTFPLCNVNFTSRCHWPPTHSPFFTDQYLCDPNQTVNGCALRYQSCEGLKATHLSRDKDDQREYYLKCLLVISTKSGLYWVLLNWGDADCHQTPDTFTIRWPRKEPSVLTKKSAQYLLFIPRGEERIRSPSAKLSLHPYLESWKKTERSDATSNISFAVFFF